MDLWRRWRAGYCATYDLQWHQMEAMRKFRARMPKKCDPVHCGQFKAPNNGELVGRPYELFDEIRAYRCRKGFMYPDGTVWRFIKCGRNFVNPLIGRWNDTELPDCQTIVCPEPFRNNVTIPDNTETKHRNVIFYRCADKHEFQDSSVNLTTRCSDAAVWEPKVTSCIKSPVPLKIVGRRYKPKPVDAPQAQEIGSIALIFVLIMVGLVVLLDLTTLYRDMRRMMANLRHFSRRFTHPK